MPKNKKNNKLKFDIYGIVLIIISLYLILSLLEIDSGLLGNHLKECLLGMFGLGSYLFPIIILVFGSGVFYLKDNIKLNAKFYSIIISFFNILLLLYMINYKALNATQLGYIDAVVTSYKFGILKIGGGSVGTILGYILIKFAGIGGTTAIVSGMFIISIILFTNKGIESIIKSIKNLFISLGISFKSFSFKKKQILEKKPLIKDEDSLEKNDDKNVKIIKFTKEFGDNLQDVKKIDGTKKNTIDYKNEIEKINPQIDYFPNYLLPDTKILYMPEEGKKSGTKKEIMQNIKILDETLKSFNVNANVTQVNIGPSVTRYELQLGPGVKVSKVVNLTDDITLSLASKGIRIEAPIPGKAAVGIEVPNKEITNVYLKEVLESKEFNSNKSKISFALGQNVSGANIIADIAKMPHLLIAGATGSGKSVCISTLITSILFRANPDEVKMLLIDPKVVELSIYNGIPHLLTPVVTDPKKAAGALNWAVKEMSNRYKMFAAKNVRDINGFNKTIKERKEKLSQIIIIIDELSDLMMVSPNEVEDSICRLAQMARAAGLHLVVATQRPSVDVITGLIKANIPSRISFAVSSQIDSRTILDMGGAEKLLGKGDMLYYPVGESKPMRVQGTYISQKEIEILVDYIKKQVPPDYLEEIVNGIENVNVVSKDTDELLEDATNLVIEAGQASILMLQRRLKIGYNRAARIIDQLEERRIIGGFEGSKPRKVLINKEEWQ